MQKPSPSIATIGELEQVFLEHARGLSGAVRGVLGSRGDVSEVLQDAFLKALRGWRAGAVIHDPVAWVFVITLHAARDHRRGQRRREANLPRKEVDVVHVVSKAADPRALAQRSEALDAARAAIHTLKEKEREVFLLRVSGGCTFAVIAETLGIPVATAKSRMRAALAELQRKLSAWNQTAVEVITEERTS